MLILVGYASAHGSTEDIARRIAGRLREHGHRVDVRSLAEPVTALDDYDAVVLGSAVHNSTWIGDAAGFVRRETGTLARRPVWLFSVGLARVLGGRFEKATTEPRGVPELRSTVKARDHRLLTGAIQPSHLPLFGRMIYRLMGGRYGDFRDWAEIDAWAEDIAGQLAALPRGARRR